MAKNKLEVSKLSADDLGSKLLELDQLQSKQTFDHAIKGIENPMQLRARRRDIARINTELRAREIGELSGDQLSKRDRIRLRRK
jgi:large subunit ribosomal protein L29